MTKIAKMAAAITIIGVTIGISLKYIGLIRVLAILWTMISWIIGAFSLLVAGITFFVLVWPKLKSD